MSEVRNAYSEATRPVYAGRTTTSAPNTNGGAVETETSALDRYAGQSVGMAGDVMRASTAEAASSYSALVPAMGPIGQTFMAAYREAEANHLDNSRRVAAAHAAMADSTARGARAYDEADDAAASEIKGSQRGD